MKNTWKLGLATLSLSVATGAFAAKTGCDVFEQAPVKVQVYLDEQGSESPFGKEVLVLRENNVIKGAWYVSTGVQDKSEHSIKTDPGCYDFEKINGYRNGTTPNFHPAHSVGFDHRDFGNDIMVPRDLRGIHAEQAIHDSMPVNGEPASHGCIRTPTAGVVAVQSALNGDTTRGKLQIYSRGSVSDEDSATIRRYLGRQ